MRITNQKEIKYTETQPGGYKRTVSINIKDEVQIRKKSRAKKPGLIPPDALKKAKDKKETAKIKPAEEKPIQAEKPVTEAPEKKAEAAPVDDKSKKPAETKERQTTLAEFFKKGTGVIKEGAKSILDAFRRDFSTIDIVPEDDSYKNISNDEGAKMLGYFTQKMESKGFPWTVFKPGQGVLRSKTKIGEYEALVRLKNGESVVFQPRRVLGLGIAPPGFKGKDIAGNESTGKMNVKTGGVERDFGAGMRIDNFAELKFLYELYNPEAQVDMAQAGEKTKAAKNLSFFTAKTLESQYPWKLYKPKKGIVKKIWNGLLTAAKASAAGVIIGGLASLAAGGIISMATGALVGSGLGVVKALYNMRGGEEISPFEALHRLSHGEEVSFQEKKKHEFGLATVFPVALQFGSLSFYVNHGTGSTLKNFKELELFTKMQDQLDEKKK